MSFLFTDVVGSTRRWETDQDAMAAELAEHDAAIAAAVAAHGGTLLKTKGEGDSTVSVFSAAADALAAAADAQRAVVMPVRMAVHTGPAEARDGDYFGPTLNRTARLRAIAHAGQVICSEAVAVSAEPVLTDLRLVDVGIHRLKDLTAPEHVYQLAGDGLAADFPPLNSLNRATTNLPAQPSSFVGRAAELAHVRELIGEARLVTLIGTGGSGKTRLALEVAAELFDDFPDGVWFCELAPISDDGAVSNVVAAAANITLFPGEATPQTVAALADKAALVVLDNCEHVVEGAAAFTSALLAGAPKVRVIATSRERLRIAGESAWTVPPLALPASDALATTSEAVQLFFERALAVAPTFTVDEASTQAVIAICRRVEAVPLAIELAAARVRVLNVHDLRARLEQHWDILSGGDRDALPHQRSLRATIDWSHSLLSPLAQRVLHRLAVFRGGFELAAAEQVLVAGGVNEFDALDTIQDLLDKSLIGIDPETGRYRMLETVREYALEQLVADDALETTQRDHARYLVATLRDVEDRLLRAKEQRNSLLLVAREHDNIAAALTWALDHDHAIAGDIVGYAFPAWYGLAQPEIGVWYARFLPLLEELRGETLLRAAIAVGTILGYLGDKETGYRVLDQAVTTARELGDNERLAMALCLSGSVRRIYEELDAALPLTREALSIPLADARPVVRALVWGWSGWVLLDTGHEQEGRDTIVAAHKLCVEIDDHLIRGSIVDSIGHTAPDYMSLDDAHAALLEERAWLNGAGAAEETSGAVSETRMLMRARRWADALASLERTLTLPLTHWRQAFFLNIQRAALLQLLDRCDEALALDEQLYRDARTTVDRHHALCDIAIARRDVGDLDGAERDLDAALQYLLDGHNPGGGWGVCPTPTLFGWLLLFKATLLIARGETDSAKVARVVGVAEGFMAQSSFDISFEVARISHGFEDRLPAPDPDAVKFAQTATLTEALAYA